MSVSLVTTKLESGINYSHKRNTILKYTSSILSIKEKNENNNT